MAHKAFLAPSETHGKLDANLNSRFYERIAPIYDSLYDDVDAEEAVRQWCLLVKRCTNLPRQNQETLPRMLDLGCGTGKYLEPWAAAGFCVTGVDGSSGMISTAQRRRKPSGWSSRIHLVHGDLRKPSPSLMKAGPFDIAVAHFNFFNLFPPSDIPKVLKLLSSCMSVGARLFTDCASPAFMPEAARDRIVLGDGEVIEVVTKPDPGFAMVTRSYRFGVSEISEKYWLHSTSTLRAAAAAAGWRLEKACAWNPVCPHDPWRPPKKGDARHRMCVFRLRTHPLRQASRGGVITSL